MRRKHYIRKIIIIIPILILIQLNQKVNCNGLSLSKLMYNGNKYMAFNQPTNDVLFNQINYLINQIDHWDLKLGKFYLKGGNFFTTINNTDKVFDYNNNHYFFSFNLQNINLYYQLTHSNLNDFYKLSDIDIWNNFNIKRFNEKKPQYMSNYFYYMNDELIFKCFDDFKKNKPELKYISDYRTIVSYNIKNNLNIYK